MCMITCQVGSTESKCWELEGGIIYNGTVQLGKEISAWPYKICCLVYCQRMGCKMWSLSKDLDSKNDFGANDLCCVFCGEYALNCIVCVCVCWEWGRMLDLILLFHTFPWWTKLAVGRYCKQFKKAQTKHTFQEEIKNSTSFPLEPCFLWLRWAIVNVTTGGASFYSMRNTDRSLYTRHYWKSSAESKGQMLCSF